jgi:hypothetical protein
VLTVAQKPAIDPAVACAQLTTLTEIGPAIAQEGMPISRVHLVELTGSATTRHWTRAAHAWAPCARRATNANSEAW